MSTFLQCGKLFDGLGETVAYYFVHSFHLEVAEEDADIVVATCFHGMKVTAAVHQGNIFSVQFHPEASPGPTDTGFLFDDYLRLVCAARA